MSKLDGNLYASGSAQKRLFKVFFQLRRCVRCQRFFTEMENVGAWLCKYHPGEYNFDTRKYTCCGETATRNYGQFAAIDHMFTWSDAEVFSVPPLFSKGCKRCDCVGEVQSPIPAEKVMVSQIASMIPAMQKQGSKLKDRPGFCRDKDVKKMLILRQQRLPQREFHCNIEKRRLAEELSEQFDE
jgi:hypothetical protein